MLSFIQNPIIMSWKWIVASKSKFEVLRKNGENALSALGRPKAEISKFWILVLEPRKYFLKLKFAVKRDNNICNAIIKPYFWKKCLNFIKKHFFILKKCIFRKSTSALGRPKAENPKSWFFKNASKFFLKKLLWWNKLC